MLVFHSECSHEHSETSAIQPNTEYLLQVGATERESTKTERKEGKNCKNREGQTYFGSFVHWFSGQYGESGYKLCPIRAFESLMRNHTHTCLRGLTHIHTHNLWWTPSCSERIHRNNWYRRTREHRDKCKTFWNRFKFSAHWVIKKCKQRSFSLLSQFQTPLTFIRIHTKSNTHLWCERQLHASSSCAWLGAEGTCPIRPIHTMPLHSHKPCDLPWPRWGPAPSPWPSVHTLSLSPQHSKLHIQSWKGPANWDHRRRSAERHSKAQLIKKSSAKLPAQN